MFVVEISFEEIGEVQIYRLWKKLLGVGVSSAMVDKPFKPHVSLGMIKQGRIKEALDMLKRFA